MNTSPQYIDLQINGYAGADFNSPELTDAEMHESCRLLREDGVAGVLATVITDELPRMEAQWARLADMRRRDPLVRQVVWGFHIEGPFINATAGYVGAHPPQCVRPADVDSMKRLLDAAEGLTRLVTLAPENDPGMKTTEFLARQNILVAAGHCDPSLDQLRAAIDAGLSMVTHLGNGCPMLMHRHDNIIQRAISLRDRLTLCFIADGAHIPLFTLKNYLDLIGLERTVVVTDAIMAARLGPGRYTLGAQSVDIGDDLVARSPDSSHFMGSTATMPRMVALLAGPLGLSRAEIRRLLVENPRAALGRTGLDIAI